MQEQGKLYDGWKLSFTRAVGEYSHIQIQIQFIELVARRLKIKKLNKH